MPHSKVTLLKIVPFHQIPNPVFISIALIVPELYNTVPTKQYTLYNHSVACRLKMMWIVGMNVSVCVHSDAVFTFTLVQSCSSNNKFCAKFIVSIPFGQLFLNLKKPFDSLKIISDH